MKTASFLLIFSFLLIQSCSKDDQPDQTDTIDYTTMMAPESNQYNIQQAMSDNAQLTTIAFSGLAFITGNSGGDSFMPPGKVADFFGFQYMRDIDVAGYGHNTQFLSRIANNVLRLLNSEQKAKLVALAKDQAELYIKFAYNRFPLMNAFRRNLAGDIPEGSAGLIQDRVATYCANLYSIDAELSYNRAVMMGEIVTSLTSEQKSYLTEMKFNDFNTWPEVTEDADLKKSMTNTEFVAVMTYASEFFSWYKGGLNADTYFCPERHGTYFGGFFLKDYPAMNNPDYFIPLNQTGDCGNNFLNTLTEEQKGLITSIIAEQKASIQEISQIRETISSELRKSMNGLDPDKVKVFELVKRYGELDGSLSGLYAERFARVKSTLSDQQMSALRTIRNLEVVPSGGYRFSSPVPMPLIPNSDYLFGIGEMPVNAGCIDPPADFAE